MADTFPTVVLEAGSSWEGRKHLDPSVTCGKCSILPITSQIDMSLVDWLGNLQSESSFTVMALNTFQCDGITLAIGWVYIMKIGQFITAICWATCTESRKAIKLRSPFCPATADRCRTDGSEAPGNEFHPCLSESVRLIGWRTERHCFSIAEPSSQEMVLKYVLICF